MANLYLYTVLSTRHATRHTEALIKYCWITVKWVNEWTRVHINACTSEWMNDPQGPTTWRHVRDKTWRVKASRCSETAAGQKMKLEDQESLSPPRPPVSGECCLCPRYTELTLFYNAMHKLTTNWIFPHPYPFILLYPSWRKGSLSGIPMWPSHSPLDSVNFTFINSSSNRASKIKGFLPSNRKIDKMITLPLSLTNLPSGLIIPIKAS